MLLHIHSQLNETNCKNQNNNNAIAIFFMQFSELLYELKSAQEKGVVAVGDQISARLDIFMKDYTSMTSMYFDDILLTIRSRDEVGTKEIIDQELKR